MQLNDQITTQGPLSRVWLASHWERKISKAQFLHTNLNSAIDYLSTVESQEPIALRVSGQLLLGVVRIHSRKTKYLLEDCNGALTKIKMVFKQGDVNLANTAQKKSHLDTITLDPRMDDVNMVDADEFTLQSDGVLQDLVQGVSMLSSDPLLMDSMEQGRLFDHAEHGHLDDVMMRGIEMARRDQDPALERSFSADLDAPMDKLQINDPAAQKNDMDDTGFDFDFDFDDENDRQRDQTPRPEFNLPNLDSNIDGSLDTLMRDGIVPVEESDNMMFGMNDDDASSVAQQTASGRRRRRLVIDRVTEIPHDDLKQFMNDTSAIINKNANDEIPTIVQPAAASTVELEQSAVAMAGMQVSSMMARWNSKRHQLTDANLMQSEAVMMDVNEPVTPRPNDQPHNNNNNDENMDDTGFDFEFGDNDTSDAPVVTPAGNLDVPAHLMESSFPDDNGSLPNGQMDILDSATQQQTQLGQRATQTNDALDNIFKTKRRVAFTDLAPVATTKRAEAARSFFDILVLASRTSITVKQNKAYGPIEIRQH